MAAMETTKISQSGIERAVPGNPEWLSLHADHLSRYLYAAGFVHGRSVLDAGTGPGYGAALLKCTGASRVQAIDISQNVVEEASQRFANVGVEFFVEDCESLGNIGENVDVICSFENIEHLNHPERFVKAAARILASDGVLLCSTPDRALTEKTYIDGKSPNPYHINEWYRDEFRELLAAGFDQVEVHAQVEVVALRARIEAAEALSKQIAYLWSSPVLRLFRGVERLFGRNREWHDVRAIATPSPGDYPIVPSPMVGVVGGKWCHFAICRKPKK
jgi:SAM-dependent methyltransferase